MTYGEFLPMFIDLGHAYGRTSGEHETQSFFAALKHIDVDDFRVAVSRLPSNELKSTYRPFPTSNTILKYVMDAQEERAQREKKQEAREIARRDGAASFRPHDDAGEDECAYGMMMADTINVGLSDIPRRLSIINAFLNDPARKSWLTSHPEAHNNLGIQAGVLEHCLELGHTPEFDRRMTRVTWDVGNGLRSAAWTKKNHDLGCRQCGGVT